MARQHYPTTWEDVAHNAFLSILRWPVAEGLDLNRMSLLKKIVIGAARQRRKPIIYIADDNYRQITEETPETVLSSVEDLNKIWQEIENLPIVQARAVFNRYYIGLKQTRPQQVAAWKARATLKKRLTPVDLGVNIYTVFEKDEDIGE